MGNETEIVNRHYQDFDEYIGRGTPAGNPFIIDVDGDRDECCDKYKKYFDWRIGWDDTFRKYILSLKGKKLGCSCKPRSCHGTVILKWLVNYFGGKLVDDFTAQLD